MCLTGPGRARGGKDLAVAGAAGAMSPHLPPGRSPISRLPSTDLYRKAFRLSIPAVFENLFNSVIFLVDAIMVASLGPAALAAAGLAGVVNWRVRSMASVIHVGATATIARRWGEGNVPLAGILFSHTATLGIAAGIPCLLLIPAAPYLFDLMRAPTGVLEILVPYFQILVFSLPLRIASFVMAAGIRAAGDTRTPMLITLVANIVNVAGNYLFIYGKFGMPELGLIGAGLGTAIAFTLEFLIYLGLGFRGLRTGQVFRKAPLGGAAGEEPMEEAPYIPPGAPGEAAGRPVLRFASEGWTFFLPTFTKRILRIAHPTFWEEVAITFGFLGFFTMINSFGEIAMAAHSATVRVESFAFLAGYGVSVATGTMVGQALGTGALADARRAFAVSLTIGTALMGIVGGLLCLFPEVFLAAFVAEGPEAEEFLALGAAIMILAGIQQPFIGATQILASGLRGAGATVAPFMIQMAGVIGVRLGVGYYLAFILEMGMIGVYWATVLDWLVRTGLLAVIVLRGRWERTSV